LKKIDQIVVENIRRLLKKRDLSQIEISRLSGKSHEHLSKVMTGSKRPGDDLLEAIAPHLGVESWELYQSDVPRKTDPGPPTLFDGAKLLLAYERAPLRDRLEAEKALGADPGSLRDALDRLSQPQSSVKPKGS
jgi:transcriptional regulator with XRE-family HTH domain